VITITKMMAYRKHQKENAIVYEVIILTTTTTTTTTSTTIIIIITTTTTIITTTTVITITKMMAYRKHQKEDAIVSEVVLRDPRPISEFAQEVETHKSERESETSSLTILDSPYFTC
jgi:hypothetical protein